MDDKWDRWEAELAAYRLRLRRERLTWEERKRLQDRCARLELLLEARRGRDRPVPHPELKSKVKTTSVRIPLDRQVKVRQPRGLLKRAR